MSQQDKKKQTAKKKKQKSNLESALYSIIQKSLKEMVDAAMNDIFKDFKI